LAVRAAVLTSKPSQGVVASNETKTNKISREALAEFLVEQVDNAEFENMAITVTDA
jgi:putative NADH-flavin reductase